MLNGDAHHSTRRDGELRIWPLLDFQRLKKTSGQDSYDNRSFRTADSPNVEILICPQKTIIKTLVLLYAAVGSFYGCGIIAAPWIIEKNFRRPEQIPSAILVFGLVFLIALLVWLSAIYMHRRKRIGRTLALIAAPITVFAFWPIGIYSWWFMLSEGGKALYGVKEDGN